MLLRCSQDAAEMQSRGSRDAVEMLLRCSRDAVLMKTDIVACKGHTREQLATPSMLIQISVAVEMQSRCC